MVQHASIQQFNGTAKESNSSTKRTASEMDTRAQHKLLLTKRVTVYNPENPKLSKKVLAFFDSGSERSYVEKALASFLKLEAKNPAEITLTGFAGVDLGTYTMHMTKLCMKTAMGEKTIEPEITTRVLREMAHVEFADLYDSDFEATQLQSPTESLQPLVLIGTDYFADFDIKTEKRLPSGFWVANSKVGRLILGKGNLSKPKMTKKVTSTAISQEAVEVQLQNDDDGLNSMVKQFFDLEAAGMADAAHPTENEQWLDHFNKELHFNMEEKRYEVALPWNNRAEELQPNYGLARGRLDNNLKKLDKEKFQLYDQIIQEQLSKGIVEMVPDPKAWTGKLHYLPHQAVIKDDHQTTKLRIVYDGSAHTKDTPSLNQCLDKGPQLLNDLIGIVMRCRMSEILICADIEKAFLQILIKEEDRDALRFLWVNTDGQVKTYRFRRVPFGLISSPAHLSVTLKHHLGQTDHPMAKDIAQNLYVDNILLCTDSSKDIAKVCHEMRKIFQKASMNLREFGANHRGIMDLPDDWLTNPHRMKILGIKWNPFKDQLEFHLPQFQAARVTKRTILSHLASVFDPLGLLSPIILPGKILLSKLWHEKYGWDDELSEQLSSEWANTIQDWPTVCFKIPRMATVPSPREKAIHIFADASGKAMGVCAYLRSINEEVTKTMLLFAKSLVVPLKTPERQNTIPRLELQALKIATSVAEKLQKELPEVTKIILWTDSRDALEWAKSGKKQDRYVENRLNKIRRYMVRFVAGTSNPADIASRGAKATELLDNNLWQFGPNWLTLKEEEWPMDQIIFDPEVERHKVTDELPIMEMTLPTMEHPSQKALIDETRFSSFIKLKRTMALVLRLLQPRRAEPKKGNLKEKLEAIPPANADELLKAEQILIKNAQQRHPAEPQLVQNLQLYEDESGILRSKGRIQKGDIAESAKDPIFLPHKAELTALIIRHVHNKLHAGANNVLAEIRQNFWVPQARRTIRHVLQNGRSRHFCHTCHKFKTKPFGQVTMPPLPQFRVDGHTSRPFLNIGLDYFGPMLTKSNGKEMKVWGCIFTCAVTRGIHIELVNDLTAEAFLNALSRFCARRKVPKLIVSDNAKTFKLGSKAAQQIWQTPNAAQIFNQPTVQKSVADKGIKWRFNIERAPWTGGFFEKMVHLVKEPLRKTLGKKLVDYEQLMTTLIEVEKIINDRPLTYISEAEQTTILRPIDFISPYLDNEIQEIWLGEDLDPKDPDFIANPTSKQSLIAKFKVAQKNKKVHYDDMYEPEEVGQTGPRHEPNGGESHQGEGDGHRLRVQRHYPNGGESHQGHGDGQRHGIQRQRSNGGESLRDNAFERRQRNRSSQNRAPQQQRAPARHEQRRATRRLRRSRSRDDNRSPPPQKDQPRQKFNWAPVPPKPQHAAPPPIMATTRPQPTKGWAPVDGVFHLSKWSMSQRCDGTDQHSNCSPVMASYLSDGLAQIYIPTLLHLLLAQILLDYSERWDAISNAIYTLTTSGLSPAQLIQAAIAQKPLIGYGYTMGKKWTRGVPNPAKWQRMRARGSPQDLWWRFSDATTAVNVWKNHCRVAQAEIEMAAQMEAIVSNRRKAHQTGQALRMDLPTSNGTTYDNLARGDVLVMPFTDSDVSDQGFLTGSGVSKTMDELERILRGKKEERPSLDTRLQRFVEARAHQANEVNTNELNVNTSEPMVVVAACTSAVQQPIEHQEEIQIAMLQAEEVPWTWGTKRYFVNDVKISATKMRELDEALEALILSQVPPPEERELKQNTFDAVRRILRRDTWEEFEICIAGSTRANTDLRTPIYVEDPHNSEDNCARNRQAQDVCRVKSRLAHAWRQFIRKKEKCRLADLGFPCSRDEDFGWPSPRVQPSRQEEMDLGEKESNHSDFDPDELVFEVPKEGEPSNERRVARWPENFPRQLHDRSNSPDGAMVYLSPKRGRVKSKLVDSKESEMYKKRAKNSGLKKPSPFYDRRTYSDSKESVAPKKGSLIKKLMTLVLLAALVRPSTQQSAMVCNQAAHPQIMELTNNFQCDQLMATKRNATLEVFKPVKRVSEIKAAYCNIIHQRVVYWKNVIFEWRNTTSSKALPTSKEECKRMWSLNQCQYGELKSVGGSKRTLQPFEPSIDYIYFASKEAERTNCFLTESVVFYDTQEKRMHSPLGDMKGCKLKDGWCVLRDGAVMVWSTPADAECQFEHMNTWDGQFYPSENVWTHKEIALSFDGKAQKIKDCGRTLVATDQGFAVDAGMFLNMINNAKGPSGVPKKGQSPGGAQKRSLLPMDQFSADTNMRMEMMKQNANQTKAIIPKPDAATPKTKAPKPAVPRPTVGPAKPEQPSRKAQLQPVELPTPKQATPIQKVIKPKTVTTVQKYQPPRPTTSQKAEPPKPIVVAPKVPSQVTTQMAQPTSPPEGQPKSRNRGRVYDNPRQKRATVHTEQLASQLTASQVNTMGKLKLLVCWLMKQGPSSSLTTGNPTMVARTLLRQQFVQAKWVSMGTRQIIKIWQCLPMKRQMYEFAATNHDFCSWEIPISLSLPDRKTVAYLDPVTLIITDTPSNGSCADYQSQTLLLEGQIVTVDQIKGDTIVTEESEVTKVEFGTTKSERIPALDPLIFHNLALFNDSDPTIQALAMFKAYRLGKQLQQEAHQARAEAAAWSPLPSIPSFSLGSLLQGYFTWDLLYKATALYVLGKIVMIFLKKYLKNLMQKWALFPYYNPLTQGAERANPVVRYERTRRATPKSGLEQSLEEATRKLEEFGRVTISTPGGAYVRTHNDAWQPEQPLLPLPVCVPRPTTAQIEQLINLLNRRTPSSVGRQPGNGPPVKAPPNWHNCRGAVCDFRLSYGRVLSPKCKVVTINRNRNKCSNIRLVVLQNHGVFWHSAMGIQADVGSTLVQLHQRMASDSSAVDHHQRWDAWLNALRSRDTDTRNGAKAAERTADERLNPLRLLRMLNVVLPDNTILVADGKHHDDYEWRICWHRRLHNVQLRGPLQWLDPGAFGTLGCGAGFALGAKAVHPDCPVLILYGDGACGFSLMDIDSFVRHRLPVVALIGNDACLTQIARDQVPWFNSAVGCELSVRYSARDPPFSWVHSSVSSRPKFFL
ncbi:hypothetical protein niasHT_036127 [Heterodera trifolii]|uniref:2-hydroxyacyl-CoA lyase 2 n=1 Tax=Heterodera trifolii TaxID=157864 RepID=A0ABD2IBP8_9BILA